MMLKVKHCCFCFSFPSSSAGKESTCNAGDPGSNPGLGRPFGDRIGYPLQYSWASLVTQMVKKPAMWETWVWSLGWEDALEEGMATHSSILAWRNPMGDSPHGESSMGSQRVRHYWATKHSSPPGFSVHGISHGRILEWVVISSRVSSRPREQTYISCLAGDSLPTELSGKHPSKTLAQLFFFFLNKWGVVKWHYLQ